MNQAICSNDSEAPMKDLTQPQSALPFDVTLNASDVPAVRWSVLVRRTERLKNLLMDIRALADDELKRFIDSNTGAWQANGMRRDFPGLVQEDLTKRTEPVQMEDFYAKEGDLLRGKQLIQSIFDRAGPLSAIQQLIAKSDFVHNYAKPAQPHAPDWSAA